jgi:hypothetical protein
LILTLVVTILLEGIIVSGYSIWRKKPLRPILFTSIIANLITQSFLWIVVNLFFQHYLVTLVAAEVFIWIIEGFVLCYVLANQLTFTEAISLSLSMNLLSFALGWVLPI